ncbi:MAG: DUF6064 family protein [Sporomusaceae bacterium]|nr:DUF6064 family protein [Sporomusaceae bacterium]
MNFPFTREQFINVFQTYNATIFPLQIIFFLAGSMLLFLVFSKIEKRSKLIGYILGVLRRSS